MTLTLDEFQQAVVDWRQGEAVVAAAAGSGKTFTAIERVAALLRENVDPQRILALMYNKRNAETFKSTLASKLGPVYSSRVQVFTFHAWGFALLRTWYPGAVMLREVLGAPKSKINPAKPVYLAIENAKVTFWKRDWRAWLKMADYVRDRDLDWTTTDERTALRAEAKREWKFVDGQVDDLFSFLEHYEAIKREGQFAGIDFADMQFYVCRALRIWRREGAVEGHPVQALQHVYEHVMVDEAQDLCPARWSIALHLGEKAKSLVSTGDLRQACYGFTGAVPERMRDRLDAGATLLTLPVNRRSTAAIVEQGNEVARGHDWHLGGDCLPLATNGRGTAIDVLLSESTAIVEDPPIGGTAEEWIAWREAKADADEAKQQEAVDVVDRIYQALRDHHSPNRFGVLSRTNRGLLPFELQLISRDVPYRVLGRSGAWSSEPGEHVLSYLRLAEGITRGVEVLGIMNRPLRYCRKADAILWITHVREMARAGTPVEQRLSTAPLYQHKVGDGLHRFVREMAWLNVMSWTERCAKVGEWLMQSAQAEIDKKREKEEDAIGPRKPFEDISEDDEEDVILVYRMLCDVAGRCRDLAELEAAITTAQRSDIPAVELGTVHRWKGFERDVIFLTGCRQGMLPHKRATDIEEERRIFYVACTRAKHELVITTGGKPSEFLVEMGLAPADEEEASPVETDR